jgi:hypothetical protein
LRNEKIGRVGEFVYVDKPIASLTDNCPTPYA